MTECPFIVYKVYFHGFSNLIKKVPLTVCEKRGSYNSVTLSFSLFPLAACQTNTFVLDIKLRPIYQSLSLSLSVLVTRMRMVTVRRGEGGR